MPRTSTIPVRSRACASSSACATGIEIEDATWEKLRALAREYRLDAVLDLA
ncbi:LDH2 family malate/lactate/ureidoglycolate dehydrogenase [Bradyrhizobium liaoningense]